MELHWAYKYIGRPWVSGMQGPDSFDCWGFFRFVQLHEYGIDVPFIDADADNFKNVASNFKNSTERENWEHVAAPSDGDAVLMAHCKYPSHVGIWLSVDGGGIIHCVRGEGVVFSNLTALRNSGWSKIGFYRHASNIKHI